MSFVKVLRRIAAKLEQSNIPYMITGAIEASFYWPEELSFLNRDMRKVVEPATFKIMLGGNSVDLTETKLEVVPK